MFQSLVVSSLIALAATQDPIRPYPLPDAQLEQTSFLNHTSYVSGLDDRQWYLDNIPFVDLPDQTIQDVYYYRASVIKRHLKYVHEGHGWVFTEFIHPVSWASKFQTIPDSAPHHLVEARWLRDPSYVKNTIQLYTRGAAELQTGISYTHYVQDAMLEHAQATGDVDFLTSQLDGMIAMYRLWDVQYNTTVGLYHRTPLSDAQEFSLPDFVVGGPNGGPVVDWNSPENNQLTIWIGPETYRPSFNSYMIANARAISTTAQLAGNASLAAEWSTVASKLYDRMEAVLWNQDIQFWIDVVARSNIPAVGRELIGYYPFRFDQGTSDQFVKGLEAGLTTDHFLTEYGPTTLEQSNEYYTEFKNLTYCCLWNGQSWPFSTSVYLGTLARIARTNRSSIITPEFFQNAMSVYARTNYDDGGHVPFTAEAHYPTIDAWSGSTTNHSEHYLHSTYLDNIFTNLIGIIPTLDDRMELQPLIPSNWSYFAVESLPYHGSLFSILWDQDGSHYSQGTGLSIFQDGTLIHNQPTLTATNITLTNATQAVQALASQRTYSNILTNANAPWGLPNVTADFVFSAGGDTVFTPAYKMIDGYLWYDDTPDNRWHNNQSFQPFSNVNVQLARPRTFNSISLAIIDDSAVGGQLVCPESITVSTRNGSIIASRSPWTSCKGNALNTINFDLPSTDPTNATTPAVGRSITTDYFQIFMTTQRGFSLGITELQVWVPENTGPRYELEDAIIGTFIGGFQGRGIGLNGTVANGGVALSRGGWAELAGVRSSRGEAGSTSITVVGSGTGSVYLGANYLSNSTIVDLSQGGNQTVQVDFLRGANVLTVYWESGTPFVDAVVVG